MLGTVRIRTESVTPVFVGIGPASEVETYLAGVRREVSERAAAHPGDFRLHAGGAPSGPPTVERFWVARAVGSGTHLLSWTPAQGSWRVVLMNPDGSAGVRAELAAGARFPHLLGVGLGMLGGGLVLLLVGGGVMLAAVRRRT